MDNSSWKTHLNMHSIIFNFNLFQIDNVTHVHSLMNEIIYVGCHFIDNFHKKYVESFKYAWKIEDNNTIKIALREIPMNQM